ncbi:putative transporter [Cercospora beticola]|uniref:Cercosporin MFS transporter CTB4 n=1 Tax=Cercospora beticola TaxID=122368 RepID=A0A2G5I9B3_CERBT|nr:putative transporter [Cercospora beticola]PIB01378.1 putative transporter [Cercospora beticola]WPA97549.1 hypothetical protein RHO25_002159 [Cercospora beticola]
MVLSEKSRYLPDEVSDNAEQNSPAKLTSGPQTPRLSAEQSLDQDSIRDLDIERNASLDGDAAATARDEFEVWWEEPADQDPENPLNWTNTRKIITIITISFVTFLTPLASSMFAPGVPNVLDEFNTDSEAIATFVVSIFVLGFAFGPLIVAPCSELYGRNVVYHVCNIFFVVFTICNAVSTNIGMLLAFRFLAGFAGVGAVTIGSGTISDMIPAKRRGLAMSCWSLGPLFGPVIGPIAGGYLTESAGWRWVFWVITIAAGISTVACFFILKETYADTILTKKAERLRKKTGNPAWHPRLTSKTAGKQLIKESFARPMQILLFSPVASLMCFYIATLYGLLYILFTTFTFVFVDQYDFSTGSAGLSYLGSGVGTVAGLFVSASFSDFKVRRKLAMNQEPQPEDRLPWFMVLPGSLSIPVGFLIYGWGAHYRVHWIVPQIGTAVIGFSVIIILMCIQTYLVDTYNHHAASAIAASTILRNLLGALLPLSGLSIYDGLGLGWGNTLFGLLALCAAPIPMLFGMFGERLRNRAMVTR